MIWLALAGFFFWLAAKEIYHQYVPRKDFDRPDLQLSKGYFFCVLAIGFALAYQPYSLWRFESFLTDKAKILAETNKVDVHCNTLFDTIFDTTDGFAAGHANFETGQIVLGYSWCKKLRSHLNNPKRASRDDLFSIALFAHEAMHVRGERNESITECQAVQRYYRAGKLLGLPDSVAKRNGLAFFNGMYQERAQHSGNGAGYYSAECAPGKALDEKLADSVWK
jgi:hypothetical protein